MGFGIEAGHCERKERALCTACGAQGDVGCGKTAVAFLGIMAAAGSGYQAAMMLPTEILAAQTHAKLQKLIQGMPEDMQPRAAILTGSTRARERREVRPLELDMRAAEHPCTPYRACSPWLSTQKMTPHSACSMWMSGRPHQPCSPCSCSAHAVFVRHQWLCCKSTPATKHLPNVQRTTLLWGQDRYLYEASWLKREAPAVVQLCNVTATSCLPAEWLRDD